jgi:DNA-directed RNA polymerase specialized sigma24 family protein
LSERALDRDPHRLLDHDDFLRALARSLVADAARADDVVQQTYAAALASPTGGPRQASSLRAWLASVVRHLAWKLRRSMGREQLG